jgi:hypothetical protein
MIAAVGSAVRQGVEMRHSLGLYILLIGGCAAERESALLDEEQARTALAAQAEEVGRAALNEDHARMAELTEPALVERFGGRREYVRKLETIAVGMKGRGYRLTKSSVGEPSRFVRAGRDTYAVVPTEVEMTGPGGAGKAPSFLVAVSRDGGATWKFVDGAGVRGDRARLKALLPNFPEELELPAARPPVFEPK